MRERVSLCSTRQPCSTVVVIYAPSLLIQRKLVSGYMWQMGGWKETLMHSVLPLLLFTTEAILQAVYHLCITAPWRSFFLSFFSLQKKLLAAHAPSLINGLDLFTLRSKHITEFSIGCLLLRGQDEWFNYALQRLIYPTCLVLRVLLLALCLCCLNLFLFH